MKMSPEMFMIIPDNFCGRFGGFHLGRRLYRFKVIIR